MLGAAGVHPAARGHLFYGGDRRYQVDGIDVVPLEEGLLGLGKILSGR